MSGLRVREVRKAAGITLMELAEMSGVSQSYISRIETGRQPGTVKALKAIATALNVDVGELIADGELDPIEQELIAAFRLLEDEDKQAVTRHAKSLAQMN